MSTVKANTVTASTTNGNVSIVGNGTGKVTLGDGNLIFPDADGSASQFLQTNGSGTLSFASVASPTISQSFESSAQTLSADSEATVAHGLGVKPEFINLILECTSAIDGYSVGDHLHFGAGYNYADRGLSCWADSTNVYLTTGVNFILARRTAGQVGDTSYAAYNEFDVIVRAYA